MTVQNPDSRVEYVSDGEQTVYAYTFHIPKLVYCKVYKIDTNGNISTIGFTASGIGNVSGGSVTLAEPVTSGWTVRIQREVGITQEVDLQNQESYFMDTIEGALDHLCFATQQLKNDVDDAVKSILGVGGEGGLITHLPFATENIAGKIYLSSEGTALDGADHTRAITPRGLKHVLTSCGATTHTDYINTQAKFDSVFNGDLLTNRRIYLAGTTFLLSHEIPIGNNVSLDGWGGCEIQRGAVAGKFVSTGTVGVPVTGVVFSSNLTFNGLKDTYTISGNGGFMDVSYIHNSSLHIHVKDCKVSLCGGAYYAVLDLASGVPQALSNKGLSIRNVSGCEAGQDGGGIYGVRGESCEITDVSSCSAIRNGGGCAYVSFANISAISSNTCGATPDQAIGGGGSGGGGGGVFWADYCTISNVFNNTAPVGYGGGGSILRSSIINDVYDNTAVNGGGLSNITTCSVIGVFNNTATEKGGGLNNCTNCTITSTFGNTAATGGGGISQTKRCSIINVYNNTVTNGDGGACLDLTDCSVVNARNNTATNGGGVSTAHYATLTNVMKNTATGTGGGIYDCDWCAISNIHENTAEFGGGISGCDNGTATLIDANTANQNGGGVHNCTNVTINRVYNNTANGSSAPGGGLKSCVNCTVTDITGNNTPNGEGSATASGVTNTFFGRIADNTGIGTYPVCYDEQNAAGLVRLSATTTKTDLSNWNF